MHLNKMALALVTAVGIAGSGQAFARTSVSGLDSVTPASHSAMQLAQGAAGTPDSSSTAPNAPDPSVQPGGAMEQKPMMKKSMGKKKMKKAKHKAM